MKNMKTKVSARLLAPAACTSDRVRQEIAAINRTYREASQSPEAAQKFLYDAGLVTKTGKLRKKFK